MSARLCDAQCDMLLVGDSLGMVIHGMPNTLGVTLEHMIMHGQAVMRGAEKALVVVDMPFGSFEESPEAAFRNAARVVKETGCHAVKVEGGRDIAPIIAHLSSRGVPVCAHVGLMPQNLNVTGGFKTRGRDSADWYDVIADAKAVEEAGAFAVVVEGVVEPLAQAITESLAIPTIGIGASPAWRRPDPGVRGHDRSVPAGADFREALRRHAKHDDRRDRRLRRGGARAALPLRRPCLQGRPDRRRRRRDRAQERQEGEEGRERLRRLRRTSSTRLSFVSC